LQVKRCGFIAWRVGFRAVILSDEVAVATEESKDPYCLPRLKVAIGALRLAAKAAARSG
jgi:hypothetical protein